jgi:ribosomal protein S18 acetylase RimI-like enzyme
MTTKQFEKTRVSWSGQACVVSGISSETMPQFGTLHMPLRGEASATELEPGIWYLNRLLVQPEAARGFGLGTQLLQALVAALSTKLNFKRLLVEPGGYGVDPVRQLRFYTTFGFKLTNDRTAYQYTKEQADAVTQAPHADDSQSISASSSNVG